MKEKEEKEKKDEKEEEEKENCCGETAGVDRNHRGAKNNWKRKQIKKKTFDKFHVWKRVGEGGPNSGRKREEKGRKEKKENIIKWKIGNMWVGGEANWKVVKRAGEVREAEGEPNQW